MYKTKSQMSVDSNKLALSSANEAQRIALQNEAMLEQIVTKIFEKKIADSQLAVLESKMNEQEMKIESELEIKAIKAGNEISVGGRGQTDVKDPEQSDTTQ